MRTVLASKGSRPGLVVGSCLLVGSMLAVSAMAGERGASVSRQSAEVRATSSSSSQTATPTASRSTSSSSSRGAAVTRSSYGKRGGGSDRHYSRGPRYGRNLYLGLGYWWGYWHPYYHYPIFPTLYYGPAAGRYGSWRLGAVDLNVKPKKAEVWVDGQLVGRTGKFDGFPGYLWLEKGAHELVFHMPGFRTEVREIRVLEGAVVKLRLRLEEGETVPVDQVSKARVRRTRPRSGPEGRVEGDTAVERPQKAERSERAAPGRLVLTVSPEDASVYLDGRFLGTSAELTRLHAGLIVEQGQHTLEVVRPGYEAERFEFSIESGEQREIAVELSSG